MDDDTRELIAILCARIGMIMEDASVAALTIGSGAPAEMQAKLAELKRSAIQITALIGAARALLG